MLRQSRDRLLHWLFEASLAIRGTLTALEALAGLGLIFTPKVWQEWRALRGRTLLALRPALAR